MRGWNRRNGVDQHSHPIPVGYVVVVRMYKKFKIECTFSNELRTHSEWNWNCRPRDFVGKIYLGACDKVIRSDISTVTLIRSLSMRYKIREELKMSKGRLTRLNESHIRDRSMELAQWSGTYSTVHWSTVLQPPELGLGHPEKVLKRDNGNILGG